MKFKISKGCDLYDELVAIQKKGSAAINAANKLCKQLGANSYIPEREAAWGGIMAFEFKDTPPEGFKPVYKKHQDNLYYPKATKKNKPLHVQINTLPSITYDQINKLVGFKQQTVTTKGNLYWINTVTIVYKTGYILMATASGTRYKPKPGMVEIVESEYERLSKPKTKKKKA